MGNFSIHFQKLFKINSSILNIISNDQKRKKENEVISKLSFEEFQKYFNDRILASQSLGKYGYIPSLHKSLDDEEEIKKIVLNDGSEEDIIDILFKNENEVNRLIEKLTNLTSLKYVSMYFEGFKTQYIIKDFTAASFYLSAILDNRFRFLLRNKKYKKISVLLQKGIQESQKEFFDKLSKEDKCILSNIFLLTDFIPAFVVYIERLFNGDEQSKEHFGNPKFEPKHLDRNWLMHGFRTQPVERYEVLQLLSAIEALEEIIDMLK